LQRTATHVEGAISLGIWVATQRKNKGTMSTERRQRLDEIGFIWNALESGWEEGFAALMEFKAREGHCNVYKNHREGSFRLGQWVGIQRSNKDRISTERRHRLEEIGFVWDVLSGKRASAWEEGVASLKQFKAREGHCEVPPKHVEGIFRLGWWVNRQRNNKDAMSAERRQQLDEIGINWNPHEQSWEEGLLALRQFKAREGHCDVPLKHLEGAFKLGGWGQ
jgi:hypothetical protein